MSLVKRLYNYTVTADCNFLRVCRHNNKIVDAVNIVQFLYSTVLKC